MESRRNPIRWPVTAVSTIAMLSVLSVAQAATIDSWNRDNVVTDLPPHEPGVTYDSKLFTDTTRTESDGAVIWKEGSVVTPGAQVLTDSPPGSGQNCIITTGTNRANPTEPKSCTDPFQSAKRVKLEARESGSGVIIPDPQGSIQLLDGQPVDMIFEVSATDDLARTYRVFKKYINATGERMDAFVVELGFGTGDAFTPSTDADGLKFTQRKQGQNPNPNDFDPIPFYSTPPGNADLGSLMSAGLFGDSADNENRTIDGYFGLPEGGLPWTDPTCDPDPSGTERAYYNLVVRSEDRIETVGDVQGLHYCLFGNMLPQGSLPLGYFWDEDGDPVTDADTIADWDGSGLSPACTDDPNIPNPCWQTYVVLDTDPASLTYGEPVLDAAGNFTRPDPAPVAVPPEVVQFWVDNPDTGDGVTTFYFITELDDMGLTNNNYHITVESIDQWLTYDPLSNTATFTMRTSNVGEGAAFSAPWLATLPPELTEPAAADLGVQPLDFPASVGAGQEVQLPVTVVNNSNIAASGQVIGEARDASGKLWFSFYGDIIDLAAGEQLGFSFDWTVEDPTGLPSEVTWSVTVFAEGGDTVPDNDTQTATVAIARTDVALEKLNVPNNAKTGREYGASVTVANVGDVPATGTVTVTTTDPDGEILFTTTLDFSVDSGVRVERPFIWIAPDVSKKLDVIWTAVSVIVGSDSDPSNNTLEVQTKVTPGGGRR